MTKIRDEACPNCEAVRPVEYGIRKESIPVRGIDIEIDAEYTRCTVCGEDFANAALMERVLQAAYDVYRKTYGVLSPIEIIALRKKYGASQKAFGLILGLGELTINSYESGSLPTDANNNLLKLSRHPASFIELFESNKGKIGPTQRKRIEAALVSQKCDSRTPGYVAEKSPIYDCEESEISEFTGFILSDKEKLLKMIAILIHMIKRGLYKTQINKLLFYIEFAHFRDRTVPISGWPFAAIDYGPVPDGFQRLLLEGEQEEYFHWVTDPAEQGDLYVLNNDVDMSSIIASFSEAELKTIKNVVSKLGKRSAAELTKLSHKERAWTETAHAHCISYELAKDLIGI
ncbi:DUF4065 domain-containing protein [Treponema sp.]